MTDQPTPPIPTFIPPPKDFIEQRRRLAESRAQIREQRRQQVAATVAPIAEDLAAVLEAHPATNLTATLNLPSEVAPEPVHLSVSEDGTVRIADLSQTGRKAEYTTIDQLREAASETPEA